MPLSSEWECLNCDCAFKIPSEEEECWDGGLEYECCPKCGSAEIVPPMDDLLLS